MGGNPDQDMAGACCLGQRFKDSLFVIWLLGRLGSFSGGDNFCILLYGLMRSKVWHQQRMERGVLVLPSKRVPQLLVDGWTQGPNAQPKALSHPQTLDADPEPSIVQTPELGSSIASLPAFLSSRLTRCSNLPVIPVDPLSHKPQTRALPKKPLMLARSGLRRSAAGLLLQGAGR